MFSRKELAEAAYEELQKRRHFYPRMIEQRKMTQVEADKRIEKMNAIYRVLINLPDEAIQNQ